MKKIKVLFLVLFVTAGLTAHAQLVVFDSALNALVAGSVIEQGVHFFQTTAHWASQLRDAARQIEILEHNTRTAMQNMRSIGDISSWSDFWDFYNRQLYLERRAIDSFERTNVRIGNNSYRLWEIREIASAYSMETRDFWENEFTEEQRRAMWLGLGLSPSNYAFVQPFRQRGMEIADEMLSGREITNDWYMRAMGRIFRRQQAMEDSINAEPEDQLGANELAMLHLDALHDMNRTMLDMNMQLATMMEAQAVQNEFNSMPSSRPVMSSWSGDGFRPLE